MRRQAAIALALVVMLTGGAAAQASPPGSIEITIERTRCFGSCPVYKVTMDQDGRVTYTGRQFVRITGEHTWTIDPSAARALADEMTRAGYFELSREYTEMITDNPTTYTTLTVGGRSMTVKDYVAGPPALKAMQRRIDEVSGVKKYVFIDGATIRQMHHDGWRPVGRDADDWIERAARGGDADVVGALIDSGYDVNHALAAGPVVTLARGPEVLKQLVAAGADVNAEDNVGNTALMQAAWAGAEADVTFLLGTRANVAAVSHSGMTILMFAARGGKAAIARQLLAAGADPAVRNRAGKNAADEAREGLRSQAWLRDKNLCSVDDTCSRQYALILKLLGEQ